MQPLSVVGPKGVVALARGLEAAYADDVKSRVKDETLPIDAARIEAREFDGDGVTVFERGGVKVIAFEVDHGDVIKPAYGYRIDYNGHSTVISGDTRFSKNLIKHAEGVDLLIHEVCMVNADAPAANPGFQEIVAHHVTAAEAGTVFNAVKPKLAVYSHLVFLSDTKFPRPTEEALFELTRKTYAGPLVIGQDLMTFSVGNEVEQLPAPSR